MQAAPNVTISWQRNGQRIDGGKFSVEQRQVRFSITKVIMIMVMVTIMTIWPS